MKNEQHAGALRPRRPRRPRTATGRGLARSGTYVRPAPARCPTRVVCGEEEEFRKTNLQNKGLISADRGTKATLVRTIPRSLFKSYTKDLLFPIFELVFQHRLKLRLEE